MLLCRAADGEVRIWKLADMRVACIRKLHPVDTGILNVRFWCSNKDENVLLISQGRNGTVCLWDVDKGMQISDQPFRTFSENVYSFCRFSLLGMTVKAETCSEEQSHGELMREKFVKDLLYSQSCPGDEMEDQSTSCMQQANSDEVPRQPLFRFKDRTLYNLGHKIIHRCDIFENELGNRSSTYFSLIAMPGNSENEVRVCCLHCGECITTVPQLPQQTLPPLGMAMAVDLFQKEDNIFVAIGFENGAIVVWDVQDPKKHVAYGKLHTEPIMALHMDTDGAAGVSGSAEEVIILFNVDYENGSIMQKDEIHLRREGISDLAVRPDNKLLATGGWDGRVRVYRRQTGRPLAILKYHTKSVSAVRFSPCTFVLASGAADGTIALYDLYPPK